MTRRIALVAVSAALVGMTGYCRAAERPNVLVLLADDMRPDSLGALGDRMVQTPNLDTLVERGFVFRNAYCMGGNVPAVCLPSRNMLLSGRAYFRWRDYLPPGAPERQRGLYAPGDAPNFPLALQAAGYETYHHGKRGNSAPLIQACFEHNKYLEQDHMDRKHGEPGREIIDAALAFLETRPRDRPFFMYLAFSNPHDPRVAAKEYLDLYQRDRIGLPPNYAAVHPFDNGEMTIRDELLLGWPRSAAEIRHTWHEYYATVSGLDRQIGRLLAAMRQHGLFENTLFVFSADQGIAIGSHGLLGKQNLYEHSAKAPLVFAGPGVPKGQSPALVYLLDIFPTVCDLVGAAIPQGLDGVSFKPVIDGRAAAVRHELLLAYREVQRAIRDEQWKLVRYPQVDVTQLFDLAADPHETRDLAAAPEQQQRVSELRRRLQKLQEHYGDSLPLSVPNPKPARWTPPASKTPIKSQARMAN